MSYSADRNKIIYYILFIWLVLLSVIFAQRKENILAEFGDEKVTAREFKERYELTPWIKYGSENSPEIKKERVLYTIIAEKLWAKAAVEKGLSVENQLLFSFDALRKMFARDAMYLKEIASKVTVPDGMIEEYYQRALKNLKVDYFFSENETSIRNLHTKLTEKKSAGGRELFTASDVSYDSNYVVMFGKMEKIAEDEIYSLKPGEFTHPVRSPHGWYIFRLREIENITLNSKKESGSLLTNVRKVAERRAEDEIYGKYHQSLLKKVVVKTDRKVFDILSAKIIDRVIKKRELHGTGEGERIQLSEDDFRAIHKELGEFSKAVLIKFSEDPVTAKDFLRDIFFTGIFATTSVPAELQKMISSQIRLFIEQELFAREAIGKGYLDDPEVKRQIDIWKKHYLAQLYENELYRSVNVKEDEVKQKYDTLRNKNVSPALMKIAIVTSENLELFEKLFNEIDAGKRFETIAADYNSREEKEFRNGVSEYLSAEEFGEAGAIAAGLEKGELYGPVKVEEGYTLVKLLDKKEGEIKEIAAYEEVKELIRNSIRTEKFDSIRKDITAELASGYKLNVNESLLKDIGVTDVDMIVYKYFGFGGRMLAMPFSPLFHKWKEKWESERADMP